MLLCASKRCFIICQNTNSQDVQYYCYCHHQIFYEAVRVNRYSIYLLLLCLSKSFTHSTFFSKTLILSVVPAYSDTFLIYYTNTVTITIIRTFLHSTTIVLSEFPLHSDIISFYFIHTVTITTSFRHFPLLLLSNCHNHPALHLKPVARDLK